MVVAIHSGGSDRPDSYWRVEHGWAATRFQTPRLARDALVIAFVSIATACQAIGSPAPDEQATKPPARRSASQSDLLTHSTLVPCSAVRAPAVNLRNALRVATWNIRAGRSASLEDIAIELETMQTDIVALQEVDVGVRRTGFRDQPMVLATALGFHHVFAASIRWDGGDYGLAVLSRWPLVDVRRHRLEFHGAGEPRIVLEVTVCTGGRRLRLFNHHADVRARSRDAGLSELRRLVAPAVGRGVLVLGDFNDGPEAAGVRGLIHAGLVDLGADGHVNTAAGRRIDYLLVDAPLAKVALRTQVWPTSKSDHHALLADFDW